MATATVMLPVAGAALDQSNPPALEYENSRPQLRFDADTDEICYFVFRMPPSYLGSPILHAQYKMKSATSGNVVLGCEVMAVTPNASEDVDSDSYDTINTVTDTVPGSAGDLAEASITIANDDSMAGSDYVAIKIRRDADNGADDATGDLELTNLSLEYTVVL